MIKEFENIVLTTDLPEYGLASGDIGTIVMAHDNEAGYEVEFVTLDGETLAVTSLLNTQIRPVAHKEIAHARSVAA